MADLADTDSANPGEMSNFMVSLAKEIVTSPINLALLGVCGYLLYKILSSKNGRSGPAPEPPLPAMKKRDLTLEQLREFDGKDKDGRICIAVNGKVFDVTRGKRFYGPDGPYGVFAGRDASRGLATFSVSEDAIKDEYDDLSDLNTLQMDSIREWEIQFTEKYVYIGKLLKPGEQPQDYTDTEDEPSAAGDRPKTD